MTNAQDRVDLIQLEALALIGEEVMRLQQDVAELQATLRLQPADEQTPQELHQYGLR